MTTFVICNTAQKLKHLVLMEIYYQLINTSLILTYTGFNHCKCYQFSGCRMKPLCRSIMNHYLQQCLNQGYEKYWFHDYNTLGKSKFNTVYNKCLKGFIKRGYYKVVLANR